jgi:regulator of extracellular matrix RemA (YlzA/DUF370 family)
MKTFTDNAGRTWTVTINVDAMKRVRDALGIHLGKVLDDKLNPLAEILEDPIRLVDVVYCLCKQQADSQAVSDVDFGRAMAGDAIMAAADAFVEALTDFFPNARARAMLTALMGKGRKVRDLMIRRAELEIEALDPEAVASTLTASSGSSPGSSASIPAH